MKLALDRVRATLSSVLVKTLLLALVICAPLHAAYAQNLISIVSGNNQSGQTYNQLNPLVVGFSGSGNVTLNWQVNGNGANFQNTGTTTQTQTLTTTAGATSSVNIDLQGTVGPLSVTATCAAGCTGTAAQNTVTFNETVTAQPAYLEMDVVSGTPQSGAPNTALAQPLVISLAPTPEGFDGPFTIPIQWSIASGTATFAENQSQSYTENITVGSGGSVHTTEGQVSVILGATAGPVLVSASCASCTVGMTRVFRLSIVGSTVTLQKISGDGQSGAVGTPADSPLVVQLGPAGGYPSGQAVTWSVISGQAILSTTSTPVDSSGQASINFTYGANPGPVTIQASVGTVNVDFTATAVNPGVGIASGNGQVGIVGSTLQPFEIQLTAPATSSLAKSLSGITVNWSVTQGGGKLVTMSTTTSASGTSSNTLTLGPNPGANTVTATVLSMGNATASFTATAVPATPNLIIGSGNNQSASPGTPLQPLVVQITSAGKGVPGVLVSWSLGQGGGALGVPTTMSDANGNASNTLTLGPSPGLNTVTASISGVGNIIFSETASASVGSGSQFTIVSGNNQALTPKQTSQPLVVKLLNAQGQPVNGAVVQWSASSSAASLANSSTSTGANGQSQNQVTVVLPGSYSVTAQLAGATGVAPLTFTFNNGLVNLPALTPTQIAVAGAIDKACPALATMPSAQLTPAQTDLLQRCSELVVGANSDTGQVSNALNQMLNNKALPQNQLANSVQLGQFGNLNTRLAELRQGAQGMSINGLTVSEDGQSLPLAMLGNLFLKDPKQSDEAGADFDRWGFFATGMIDRGGFSATGSSPGFDFHNASLTAGVDYRFSDAFVAGVAAGYDQNNSSINLNAGSVDVDGYSLNGYFTWYHNNDFYIEGSAVFDWLDYDLTRNIAYQIASLSGGTTTVNESASASPGGQQASLALSIGKDFNWGAWAISPYLRGVYTHLNLDGFSESPDEPNSPGAGLVTSVESRSIISELGVIGGRFSYTTSFDWGVLVPNATLEWNHDFRDNPQVIVTRFLADPTQTPIVITDQAPDQNYFNVGIGLNAVLPQGRSAYISWEHLVGYSGAHENTFSLGIRIEF